MPGVLALPTSLKAEEDGMTHVNIYSKGRTEIGRLLTNFAHTSFTCEDGHFESVEGYWYWLGCQAPQLRTVWGFEAKQLGRELRAPEWPHSADFKGKIARALRAKTEQTPRLAAMLRASILPFTHYYVYGGKVALVPKADWMTQEWEQIRRELQQNA